MSLYQKYRPQTFDDVVGNEDVIDSLRSVIARDSHAFLMHGPAGCGKTTLGRIIARELGCKGQDLVELDSADFRGIETIRSVRRNVDYKPLESKRRVWILDEAHALTNDAQNALLKVLEEPPPWVAFILCTTAPHKLLPTIRSRCSEHAVAPLDEGHMRRLLRRVVKEEGASLDRKIYEQIGRDSMGHPRAALTILEQVIDLPEEKRAAVAARAAAEESKTLDLCRALLARKGWKSVSKILNGLRKEEPESIRRAVLGYCQSVLLKGDNVQAAVIMETFMDPFYDNGFPQLVFCCYSAVSQS